MYELYRCTKCTRDGQPLFHVNGQVYSLKKSDGNFVRAVRLRCTCGYNEIFEGDEALEYARSHPAPEVSPRLIETMEKKFSARR